jgi:CRP-like cAMP-binding protein
MTEDRLGHLKNIPLFKDIADKDFESIAAGLEEVIVPLGKIIFESGDKGDCLYIIKKGNVSVYIKNPESNEKVVLSTLSSGDYFGEMALITGEPRSAAVEAVSEVSLFKLNKTGFDNLIKNNPSITLSLSHMLSKRLKVANIKRMESEKSYQNKITPSGNLSKVPLISILKFCEQNSLSGKLKLEKNDSKAEFNFDKGQLLSIKMDDLSEAEAMDKLMTWEDGKFIIEPSIFEINQSDVPEESGYTAEFIKAYIKITLEKLVDLIGSDKIIKQIEEVQKRLSSFFPVLNSCEFHISQEIKIKLPCSPTEELTDKEILAIAVLLQSIYNNCKQFVVGLSYLDLEKLSGQYHDKLKDISFFEYMRSAEELTGV